MPVGKMSREFRGGRAAGGPAAGWRMMRRFFPGRWGLSGSGLGDPCTAALLMLGSVLLYSSLPLQVAWAGAGRKPALFNGAWRLGALATYFVFILWRCPLLLRRGALPRRAWALLLGPAGRLPFILMLLSGLDFFWFAWSTAYISPAVAGALYELWPFGSLLLLGRFQGLSWGGLLAALAGPGLLCLAGLSMALAAQAGGLGALIRELAGPPGPVLLGGGLALLAGALAGLGICAVHCGRLLAGDPELRRRAAGYGVGSMDLARAGSAMAFAGNSVAGIPVFLTIGFWRNPGGAAGLLFGGWGLRVLLGGGLALAVSALLWREANARAGQPGINLLGCFGPFFGLGLLAAFGQAGAISWPWLLAGLILIMLGSAWAQRRFAVLAGAGSRAGLEEEPG